MSEVTAQHSKLGWWILAGLWATAPDSLESWPAAANHAARLHSSGGRAQSYQRSARPQFWVGAVDQEDSATKRLRGYRTLLRCGRSHYEQPATACTPLGAPASRLPSYTRAVVPGSASVGVTYTVVCSPPAACSMCHIYISALGPRTSKLLCPSLLKP